MFDMFFYFNSQRVSLLFGATILLLMISLSGLIAVHVTLFTFRAEYVTLFSPESRSVKSAELFNASSTDSRHQNLAKWVLNGILFYLDSIPCR